MGRYSNRRGSGMAVGQANPQQEYEDDDDEDDWERSLRPNFPGLGGNKIRGEEGIDSERLSAL
jgi:hypothetical protein